MKLSAPVFRLKREARTLARSKTIALNRALDEIAVREGFRSWSHLASVARDQGPSIRLLSALEPGDMVILGARPGQGKTILGIELLAEAAMSGRPSVLFSSECLIAMCARSFPTAGIPTWKTRKSFKWFFPTACAPGKFRKRLLVRRRAL